MDDPVLNLLTALDALLAEGSVARAAKRLRLSPSAMSRTLSRLRLTTGDPLLVRAGRILVPTPRADQIRDVVAAVVEQAHEVLRPAPLLDPAHLRTTFTMRVSDGFISGKTRLVSTTAPRCNSTARWQSQSPPRGSTILGLPGACGQVGRD